MALNLPLLSTLLGNRLSFYHLAMLGQEVREVLSTVFFKDIEWKALCCYVNKTPVPSEKTPSLRKAMYMLGAIGGHLGRKSDGFPGTQTLWRGLQRLDTATEMYAILPKRLLITLCNLAPDPAVSSVSEDQLCKGGKGGI